MTNVAPILAPDTDAMHQHLHLLFGRALAGRVEITAIETEPGEGRLKAGTKTRFFDVGDDAAVEFAAQVNSTPGWNVYVGAALRIDDVFPAKAADDTDFLRGYALFADADDTAQLTHARETYRRLGITPPFVVVTGRTPYTRAQMWWPLEEPIDDIAVYRAALRGIATALKTDTAVCTGKQLMRLGGSISWPKPNKPGRILERTEVSEPANAARGFTLDQIHRAFPPVERGEPGAGVQDVTIAPTGALGLDEKVMDGREGYAFRLVRAHLHEFIGTSGAAPSLDDLYESVAPIYLKKVDQVRPGRGPAFLRQKCADALSHFHEGRIPFMRDLEEAVQSYAERQRDGRPTPSRELDADLGHTENHPDGDVYEVLSIADIKALPDQDWIVKEALPHNGFGFVYGAPGSYKTFICYDLALALAYGHTTWLDRPVKSRGSVLYLASEGASGFKNRITAWQKKHDCEAKDGELRVIRKSMSFMDPDDVGRLERTVDGIVARSGPVEVVFVDTVSRVLPGADENLQKDMTIFVAACDRLRERFGCVVVGVHHTNKNGDMRGSTVFLGQGDFIFRVDKDEDGKSGVLTCEKQKEAEDGWKVAFGVEAQTWVPVGRIEPVSSLTVEFKGKPEPEDLKGEKWPDKESCVSVLRRLNEAWMRGRPWSPYPQTNKEGRFAVANICQEFRLKRPVVEMMLTAWQRNEILALEEVSSNTKLKGLRVVRWPD